MFKQRLQSISPILHLISKREALTYGVLSVLVGFTEAFGFSMLLPVLRYVEEGGEGFDAADLPAFWSRTLSVVTAIGWPVTLLTLLGLAFVPLLVRQMLHFARTAYSARVQEWTTARVCNQALSAFIYTDLQFHAHHRQGALLSALTQDTHRAGSAASALLSLVATLFMLVIYLALLLAISPVMTLIGLSTAVVASLIVSRIIMPVSRHAGAELTQSNDNMYSAFVEEISAVRLVKMQAQEESDTNKVARFVAKVRGGRMKVSLLQASVNVAIEPVFLLGLFGMVYVGVEFLGTSLATLGILMLVLLRIMPLASGVNSSRQNIEVEAASLLNLQRLIREAEEARNITSGPVQFSGLKHGIEFDHVSFNYYGNDQEIWALRDVSLIIPRATMTALVGRSGAGKSTLVDLVPRLKDATQGSVRIDGVNSKEFELTTLRRAIGYLSQETFLFNDTIHNNIAYGMAGATPQQVREAAKRAYAHDFIMETPRAYDTEVGDRGVRLSAGQRQRLGIARVMLQDPDIIILDEPTSALDSESEHFIQLGLDQIRKDKTLIVIAHRLSTIISADRIIVLDHGRVIEEGDHRLLLQRDGDYSRLFDLQIHV